MVAHALALLLEASGAALGLFYTIDRRMRKFTDEVIVGHMGTGAAANLEASLLRYRARYHALDPFAPRRVGAGRAALVDSSSIFDSRSMARLPYFTEYLRQLGMAGQTTLLLRHDGRARAGIDLLRPHDEAPASRQLALLRASHAMLECAYGAALRAAPPESGNRLACAIPLTPREAQVVRLVAGGASNDEVAGALMISKATVKTHLAHSFDKLGVRSRVDLISLLVSERDTALVVAEPTTSPSE
ncbi:MAG: helix-turn-helix transcriptional regulator [Actinobacteria bacterium]|nr:helix-turn-helix transcriptional regulator [Actinomycetota bacterium]